MKGIVLAGGSGTRLHPSTQIISKQLLPVYDKPMIYYPISVLMLADITDILIISTPHDLPFYEKHFGDGSHLGLNFSYEEQPEPNGLAEAFIIGESFVGDDDVCLILGDNIFYGSFFSKLLKDAVNSISADNKATVFGYYVNNPSQYGVAEFDEHNKVVSIEEKPTNPKSNYAVAGLYFYPNDVVQKAKEVEPSGRGELEITAVNQKYLEENRLLIQKLGRGFAWLDTGTHEAMAEATQFIHALEKRQGLKVACLEEIAFRQGFISNEKLQTLIGEGKSSYFKYLRDLFG